MNNIHKVRHPGILARMFDTKKPLYSTNNKLKNILILCLLLFSLFFVGSSNSKREPVSMESIIAELKANGYKVEVAQQQAQTVSKDGYEVGNSIHDWVVPQVFFAKDNLIVTCTKVSPYTKQLEKLLGKPITE